MVAVLVIVAILATLLDTASRASVNPFSFFGFFTIQSNIIAAAVLLCAAVATFRGRDQTPLLVFARARGTTYILIVGIVHNLVLTGLEGGVSLGWANSVLHGLPECTRRWTGSCSVTGPAYGGRGSGWCWCTP